MSPRRTPSFAQNQPAPAPVNIAPNTFLIIAPDYTVTVLCKHIEMGQGPLTGMATLVAEELDADWAQMRADHAPSNPALYKNLAFGVQGTGGSSAIANSYEQMRKVGAAARADAGRRRCPELERAGRRDHRRERRDQTPLRQAGRVRRIRASGDADAGAEPMPKLKDPSTFKLIGKEGVVKRLDSVAKSNGSAIFTLDINEPDMLTVLVARAPRFGGKVASFDAGARQGGARRGRRQADLRTASRSTPRDFGRPRSAATNCRSAGMTPRPSAAAAPTCSPNFARCRRPPARR